MHRPILEVHDALPAHVQVRAKKSYYFWKVDHNHPSLDFKKLKGSAGNRFSVRIGDHHRAIGQQVDLGLRPSNYLSR